MKKRKNILILAWFFAKYTSPAQSGPNFGLTHIPPGYSLDTTVYRQGVRRTGRIVSHGSIWNI